MRHLTEERKISILIRDCVGYRLYPLKLCMVSGPYPIMYPYPACCQGYFQIKNAFCINPTCSQYSITKNMDSSLGPTATSVTLTIFWCRIRFKMLISRKLEMGNPSVSRSMRIFFNATIWRDFLSLTLLLKGLVSIKKKKTHVRRKKSTYYTTP